MTAPAIPDPTTERHAAARRTTRRTFLWTAGAAAAGGCLLQASTVGAAGTGTVTLWRLDADWGYPVGPKSVTACRCTACHHHAANKIYFDEQQAVDGRIHPCCVCQPVSFTVPAATGDTLLAMSSDGTSVDRRHTGIADVLAAGAVPAPTGAPTSTTPPPSTPSPSTPPSPGSSDGSTGGDVSTSTGDASTSAAAGGTVDTTASVGTTDDRAAVPTRAARPSSLAFTGGDTAAPLGVLALGAGAVMWGVSRRGRTAVDPPAPD